MINASVSQSAVPPRVMVVDDKDAITMTFRLMLEMFGYDVRVANNGPDAIAIATSFLPQVILLDIGLPDISGYDLCRKLQAEPELGKSVFVALTGYSQPEHRQRSREAGFHHHLVKPIAPDQLVQFLTSLDFPAAAAAA